MNNAQFVYVSYISAKPENLWNALIDPEITRKYWQHVNASDWKVGSKWEHRDSDNNNLDLVGKVVEFSPPRKLVLSWAFPADIANEDKHSRVTLAIEPYRDISCLTVTHDSLEAGSEMLEGITYGWPKVISSLKSLMEKGKALPKLW